MKIILSIAATILLITYIFSCNPETTKENTNNFKTSELKLIEKVLEEHTPYLMTIPGVVGTAIGEYNGELCIKVLVNTLSEEIETKIPQSIKGYNVVIEEVGDIKAF